MKNPEPYLTEINALYGTFEPKVISQYQYLEKVASDPEKLTKKQVQWINSQRAFLDSMVEVVDMLMKRLKELGEKYQADYELYGSEMNNLKKWMFEAHLKDTLFKTEQQSHESTLELLDLYLGKYVATRKNPTTSGATSTKN